VEVNCAAIPENLIESELFGHEKGAFTHALARRKGKIELAHTGTLFLDEIADMSLNTQSKVLRVLQEPRFERIGGEQSISVDIRLIAATNKNIQQEISDGRFREDLYFRLNVIPIHVPSLRERIDDLEQLIGYFMTKFKRPEQPQPKQLDQDAWGLLKNYPWPGNIRELKNFVERVNIMCDRPLITRELVQQFLGGAGRSESATRLHRYTEMKLGEARDEFERELIIDTLKKHGNNISRAAQSLGIYPSSLHGKIKKLGIEINR
jgi:two-component system nitrogen regulation response regulator NtrX